MDNDHEYLTPLQGNEIYWYVNIIINAHHLTRMIKLT